MEFADLLVKEEIDASRVVVLRHRPSEPTLNKVLPWLAVAKPNVFNAYQQTQGEKLEKVFQNIDYVASFIGHEAGKALFIGLYKIGDAMPMQRHEYWNFPAHIELKAYGMLGFQDQDPRQHILHFDLQEMSFYQSWKGRLVIDWPPPERSWWRRAHRNKFDIISILDESTLAKSMPEWDELMLEWHELEILPKSWEVKLSNWRAIYYIFDKYDGKGYIGSAYGEDNLLGRWRNYSKSGHGGNVLLRGRDPNNFQFSILEILAHNLPADEVINRELSWKQRLHTRAPFGLNEN